MFTHASDDLSYPILYNEHKKEFELCELGISALAYEMECENEEHNLKLLEKNLSAYHTEVTHKLKLYNDTLLSDRLEKEARKAHTDEKAIRQHEFLNAIPENFENGYDVQAFSDVIESGSDKDSEVFENEFKLMAILSKYYAWLVASELVAKNIMDGKTYKLALAYGQQVKHKCPIRSYFESVLDVGCWHTKAELTEIMTKGETQLYGEYKFSIKQNNSDKMRLPFFESLFQMKHKRRTIKGIKVTEYCIESYNPIGEELAILPKKPDDHIDKSIFIKQKEKYDAA